MRLQHVHHVRMRNPSSQRSADQQGLLCSKEALWPHVREFADRGLEHAHSTLRRLSSKKTPCELYVVHGHYADAGEVASLMSSSLGIDMVLTGHSLGRNKLEHLLASGAGLQQHWALHLM